MTLIELYNLKLNEYKEFGVRERPWKLLAMLLLSEKENYEPLRNSQGEFYKKYKKQIDAKIKKVEDDFNFSSEDIIKFIERTVVCDNYEEQKIWFVFSDGFSALNWGILYHGEKTSEQIYSHYFDCDDLIKYYDLEQKAIANNVSITPLDDLINKLIENPKIFYEEICYNLSVEERLFILRELENKSCLNCTNGCCRVEYKDKIGTNEFGEPQGSQCSGWFNAELIGQSRVLRRNNLKK